MPAWVKVMLAFLLVVSPIAPAPVMPLFVEVKLMFEPVPVEPETLTEPAFAMP